MGSVRAIGVMSESDQKTRQSPVEWVSSVPSHWQTMRLKQTVDLVRNGVWGDDPDGESDIACIRVADFDRDTKRVTLDNPTMRSVSRSQRSGRLLAPGDLLLEKSGGGDLQPVGAVVLYDHDVPAVCSNFVARIKVSVDHDARYLCYLHATLYDLRINTKSIKQTTGIQNLDSRAYFDERIEIPPLPEQHAIATFLDRKTAAIDDLIRAKERLIALLQEKRQVLITRAVTKGLDPSVPMKDSGIEWLGEVPAHWRIMHLDKVVDPQRRITYGIVQPGAPDPNGLYMVRGKDYSRGWCEPESVFRVSPAIEAPYSRARLLAGDLVMTIVGAGTGNVEVVPQWLEGANITQTTARIAISPTVGSSQFFAYQIEGESVRVAVELSRKGAAQPGLNLGHLAKFLVCCPPLDEQTRIEHFLNDRNRVLTNMNHDLSSSIECLRAYRQSLISAAVTGQIDVSAESPDVSPEEIPA